MGYEIQNDCVGCPQGCANCGRDRDYRVYYCDNCGDNASEDNPLYVFEGQELCWECYKSMFNEKLCDDMDDSRCEECGCEADFLYEVQPGIWLCEGCLKEMAERL